MYQSSREEEIELDSTLHTYLEDVVEDDDGFAVAPPVVVRDLPEPLDLRGAETDHLAAELSRAGRGRRQVGARRAKDPGRHNRS